MTRFTQTHNFTAKDHADIIEKYLGRPLDYVIVNTGSLNSAIEKKYAKYKEYPVIDDLGSNYHAKVIRGDFASPVAIKKQPGDALPRSLMRHDHEKLLKSLIKILNK